MNMDPQQHPPKCFCDQCKRHDLVCIISQLLNRISVLESCVRDLRFRVIELESTEKVQRGAVGLTENELYIDDIKLDFEDY